MKALVLTAPDRIATIGESIRITSLTNGKSLHTLPGSKSAGKPRSGETMLRDQASPQTHMAQSGFSRTASLKAAIAGWFARQQGQDLDDPPPQLARARDEGRRLKYGSVHAVSAETGRTLWKHEQRAGMLSLVATVNGEDVPGGTAQGLSYQVGAGDLLDGVDEAVTGKSAGDATSFTDLINPDYSIPAIPSFPFAGSALAQQIECHDGARVETLGERVEVHDRVLDAERVVEPALRHAAVQRHLAAFEPALVREARARLRALVPAARRLAVP